MTRKHISWKTKCAATVYELDFLRMVHFGPGIKNNNTNVPLDHAKEMTEDQYLSLWQWDHNVLHTNAVALGRDPDHFTNLRPLPIKEHREKTKQDAKIIAKSRRIRNKWPFYEVSAATGWKPQVQAKRKLHSRGFDKTKRRKMDGTVVKR